jgi:AraC-like DNA-binding protein
MSFVFEGRSSDSPLVESIWRTQTERAGSFTSAADTHSEMVVVKYEGKTAIFARGPETKASTVEFPADADFFGITFKLGTFMPHLPPRTLLDRLDSTLPEASSKSFWLQGLAWEFPTFENADTFIARLIREGLLVHDSIVDATLQGLPQDYSVHSVQYRFLQAVGLTHSYARQIERAKHAQALLRQGKSILDTVFEAGYYDQPHLTRSLKHFVGQTPAQIIQAKE